LKQTTLRFPKKTIKEESEEIEEKESGENSSDEASSEEDSKSVIKKSSIKNENTRKLKPRSKNSQVNKNSKNTSSKSKVKTTKIAKKEEEPYIVEKILSQKTSSSNLEEIEFLIKWKVKTVASHLVFILIRIEVIYT
jgi:hypothetical protein